MRRKKSQHGMVAVSEYRGVLRLRWTYQGERRCLPLGLPDTHINRLVAEQKAKIIEADIVTGNFDQTLQKYRSEKRQRAVDLTVCDMLERFMEYKRKSLYARSLDKFKALRTPLATFFKSRVAATINEEDASQFRLYLAGWLSPATQRERLTTLNACWKWALKQKLVTMNPWSEVLKRVKVPPNQKPKPFTKEEILAILEGFRSDRYYCHYADFVEFLLSTGCRLGEAIGLQWKHLSEDCSKVWIGEAITRGGDRKPTKTNRSRQFRLTSRLQRLLSQRSVGVLPDELVFPSPKGKHIDDHNFCKRIWTKVLLKAGVTHRTPYNCRHTFISYALWKGVPPMTIAEMVGHDPEVLFKHYAADIQGGLEIPEIFG